jgi:hypothetical protein
VLKDPSDNIAEQWHQQRPIPELPDTGLVAVLWKKQPAPQQIELPSVDDTSSLWNKQKSSQSSKT